MVRKSKKSSSSNCGMTAAKKNSLDQLEWSKVAGGALRGVQNLMGLHRLFELLKTLFEQFDLFG